jgi:small subunit ribosomal protein S20
MPQHKSSEKRLRQTEKVNKRNRATRSQVNTATKKVLTAVGEAAAKSLENAYSVLDKAVKRGVIHKNKAANQKSRLAKKALAAAK